MQGLPPAEELRCLDFSVGSPRSAQLAQLFRRILSLPLTADAPRFLGRRPGLLTAVAA